MNSKEEIRWLVRFIGFRNGKSVSEKPKRHSGELSQTAMEFFNWWQHNQDRMAARSDRDLFQVIEMSEWARWN